MIDARAQLTAALADRYLLEEELGRGASATVYRARDLRHDRWVALKVLQSSLGAALGVERFQREIRTQARLQHPHLLPLFDSGLAAGRLYYTMPYVATGSLRDRLTAAPAGLPVGQVVELAGEVASALGYAHALGIIHRDLKPENIMLSPSGQAIVTDFGIAYAADRPTAGEDAGRITEAGAAIGTPLYMSPEQAAGDEEVDGRADQYSLAVLVYEMLAGSPPYIGGNARATLARKLTEPAPSIRAIRADVPPAMDAALLRALARHPADRFETVEEFSGALAAAGSAPPPPSRTRPWTRRLGAAALAVALVGAIAFGHRQVRSGSADPAAPATKVLVVLPFKNLGPPVDQYFADGLTEELTSRLAGLSGLRVISRTSADQYRTSGKSLRAIGGELGAGYVLEGSVRWERGVAGKPGRIRVTPQLIAVRDDSHLWTEVYETELTEVFGVQTAIAEKVTAALDVALRGPERAALAVGGTRKPEAYDLYLRGNDYFGRSYDRNDLMAAAGLYQEAVAQDSGFALAQARLARAHAALYWFYHDRTPARLGASKRAVDAALALAPGLAESHIALGYYYYWGERDFPRALAEFESVQRQQPGNGDLLHAIGYVERRLGRWEEATASLEEARRYDPRSPVTTLDLADVYLSRRRFAEAEPLVDRAIQLAPDWASPYAYKAMLYLIWRGDRDRSRAVIGQALARVGPGRLAQAMLISDGITASLLTADTLFAPAVDAVTAEAFEGDTARFYMFKAEAARHRGLREVERSYADSARVKLEVTAQDHPDDAKMLVRLGLAHARLGNRERAVDAGRRAVALTPVASDANSGPFIAIHLAEIYTLLGDYDQAVATLEPVLAVPSWLTPAELRADPAWAELREHPGFRALAEMGA